MTVIIVNWNVRDLLGKCLRSLFAHNPPLDLEVYVVDNHSSDGSVELVAHEFPQVNFIENDENIGFSRANNQGIRHAQGRYILLLNPDTVWIDDTLRRMVAFMDSRPEIGVVGPKLLNADGQSIQYTGARRLPRPIDIFFEYSQLSSLFPKNRVLGRYLMGDWDHADSRDVDCLSGSCMLIRRETIQEVGLLDDGYPLYAEDIDWCHRVCVSRWKLHYFAEGQLIHIGRQSALQNLEASTVNAIRGIYRYYRKFYGITTVLWLWLLMWLASMAKVLTWAIIFLVKSSIREFALRKVKAFWRVCWLLPIGM